VYTPKRAITEATRSHWDEANHRSVPKYPIPAKIMEIAAPDISTCDTNLMSFFFKFLTPF